MCFHRVSKDCNFFLAPMVVASFFLRLDFREGKKRYSGQRERSLFRRTNFDASKNADGFLFLTAKEAKEMIEKREFQK